MQQRNSRSPIGGHVFVDESKARDYLLVAAVVLPSGVSPARRTVRELTARGAPRLHMKHERDDRKKKILSELIKLDLDVTVYRAARTSYRTELERRRQCLRALVADIAEAGRSRLCLERDETLVQRDRQVLIEETRRAGCTSTLHYEHAAAEAEPMLAIPDAIAWAWAKGGDWRRRCGDFEINVVEV